MPSTNSSPKLKNIAPAANQKPQIDRFIKTARALGADEDEAAFKAKLAVIARQKPAGDNVSAGKRLPLRKK